MREITPGNSLIVNLRFETIESYSFRTLSSNYMKQTIKIRVRTLEMSGDNVKTEGEWNVDLVPE